MPRQPLLPVLMPVVILPNQIQTIPHQKLVIPRREQCSRYVDQNGDPRVVVIGEDFAAEEDGGDDAGSQVTGEVSADRNICVSPYHTSVSQPYSEWHADGGDEGVGGVET